MDAHPFKFYMGADPSTTRPVESDRAGLTTMSDYVLPGPRQLLLPWATIAHLNTSTFDFKRLAFACGLKNITMRAFLLT